MIDIETNNHFDEVIDRAIARERKIFNNDIDQKIETLNKENQRYMLDLKKTFSDEVKLIAEVVSSKPDEGRVREIIHEEIKPLKTDVEIIKREVSFINSELSSMNKELRQHNAEMKQLRKESNSHGKKLTRLENVLV